ncbi:hypothetical protein QYS36_06785 [Pseudomonas sp. G34]|uniref:hypothetical protein n=1 Tax=Pseudomonas sp. G34 TaxID=3059083 RepID=UPI002806757C|nr:hypothetical protein [Pseudomonas sp. G34]MDQ7984641.1 hypothetical protein [Pseudomonas sp. G34]
MSPESYILLMISGWLLVSAAMLWGMLRLLKRHQLEAQLADEFPSLPASPSDPVWRRQHAPRRAKLRARAQRTCQQHAHVLTS